MRLPSLVVVARTKAAVDGFDSIVQFRENQIGTLLPLWKKCSFADLHSRSLPLLFLATHPDDGPRAAQGVMLAEVVRTMHSLESLVLRSDPPYRVVFAPFGFVETMTSFRRECIFFFLSDLGDVHVFLSNLYYWYEYLYEYHTCSFITSTSTRTYVVLWMWVFGVWCLGGPTAPRRRSSTSSPQKPGP